ncbi:NAD(P)-dependent oxidoreductase [Corynebacterium epidermidicanis]|uniref:Putative NADH-flavin reductase n=1 Tax=Corynebacterium epidermidicanis TaxID=1050174 RepID=A0A0G3GND0_9CORY|nr:NAD(P)H-binding protein [Corynebacterium epidermidicanis]AKK02080.1 putative NADH-flavin reductase [Corynebacterium epidermidicanis]
MKILVLGATGMVGKDIAAEAEARGHEVTRASRSTGLNITDTAALLDAINAHDTTIIAVPTDRSGGSMEPVIAAHRALIDAAPAKRLLITGGAGSLLVDDTLIVDQPDFPEIYAAEARAFVEILDLYRNSTGLNWTMLSPAPVIEPGPATGHVLGTDSPAGEHVTTENFAVAMLDEAENPQFEGRRFTVADA